VRNISAVSFQERRFAHYRDWAGKLDLVMRQTHRAGEKLFVDYAGQTIEVIDRHTGEVRSAELFVAVLGASNYTYAEASWTQTLPDWIGAHVRAFQFIGGVSEVVVPDNLRSGVSKAHRYEPDLNPTYHEMARHYQVAVVPARVRRARDKAKVEQGVLLVERWILARLRHRTFFSLAELNGAIAQLLERLNNRPSRSYPAHAAKPSSRSISPHYARCRPPPTYSTPGRRSACISTTTSRSTATTTRCLTRW
jgi:transposase